GVAHLPAQRLENVIATDLDVRRHEVWNGRIGAAKENVFSSSFQIIVDDVEWTRAVPAAEGLRVVTDAVNLVNVRVTDGDLAAVQTHATLHVLRIEAMNPTAIDHQVVRHVSRRLR